MHRVGHPKEKWTSLLTKTETLWCCFCTREGGESREPPPSVPCSLEAAAGLEGLLLTLVSNWPPVLGLGGRGTGFPAAPAWLPPSLGGSSPGPHWPLFEVLLPASSPHPKI